MVIWNLHIQRRARVSEILSGKYSALLTNEQRSRISVAANVVWADGQVGDLEILDAVNVQALVKDTVLDNGVTLTWGH